MEVHEFLAKRGYEVGNSFHSIVMIVLAGFLRPRPTWPGLQTTKPIYVKRALLKKEMERTKETISKQ